MFVSLEPCSHYGKTPPCAEAIIKSGIEKVNIAITDPNPLVSGKGIEMLKNGGVDVVMMEEFYQPAYDLIRGFEKLILKQTPFVISKSAVTLDGRIATSAGDSKWITGAHSRYITHKLRAKSDAIVIGKNTYEADNPSLNVRLKDFSSEVSDFFKEDKFKFTGYDNFFLKELLKSEINEYKDPFRVIAGCPEVVHENSPFFKDDNYVIIADKDSVNNALKKGYKNNLLKLNIEETGSMAGHETSLYILEMLKRRGALSVMLEGGSGLNSSFLGADEIDQLICFIAPKIIGNGISVFNNTGSEKMIEASVLHHVSLVLIGDDLLYSAYTKKQ
jgi:diaminohydroxyphosphoribosylaminopyrimidine deaminase/5-amino-6-(5-phosphoribosylamino)uracil reductase